MAILLIVASVVPLTLLQLPNLIGSDLPAATLARIAGHASPVSLIRASGLALPVMACVAPVAAVLARRRRAWPVLLAGLLMIGAADLLGDSASSILTIGADRVLHGLGAGLALPATLALAWECSPRWSRLLARWWVLVAIISLFVAVPLMRDRLASAGWRAALQPFPWLTAAGLAATALYVAVAGGAGRRSRSAVTPAERSQLALLAVPLAGLGALDIGVSSQNSRSVAVAAGVAVVVLAALAMVSSADRVTGGVRGRRARLCFPLIAACAGFALAPTAGEIAILRPLAGGPEPALRSLWLPLAAAAAGCLLGTGIAWLSGRRAARPLAGARSGRAGAHAARPRNARNGNRATLTCAITGLICAAAGLAVAHTTAPAAGPRELAIVYALLGGGLAMALGAGVAEATPAGALSGLSLTLAGALTGYLVAGAIQIRMVSSLTLPSAKVQAGAQATAQAQQIAQAERIAMALTRATSWWAVAAAAAAVATAAGVFFIGRARRGQEQVAARG